MSAAMRPWWPSFVETAMMSFLPFCAFMGLRRDPRTLYGDKAVLIDLQSSSLLHSRS